MSTRSRASRERMGEACPRSFAKEPLEDSPLHCEEIFNPFSTLRESPDPRKPSRSAPGHFRQVDGALWEPRLPPRSLDLAGTSTRPPARPMQIVKRRMEDLCRPSIIELRPDKAWSAQAGIGPARGSWACVGTGRGSSTVGSSGPLSFFQVDGVKLAQRLTVQGKLLHRQFFHQSLLWHTPTGSRRGMPEYSRIHRAIDIPYSLIIYSPMILIITRLGRRPSSSP